MEDLKLGIVIIGYNKLAKSVIDILELINTYNISGIIDIKENTTPFITEYTVFDDLKTLLVLRKDKNIKYVIICVQDSKHKKEISEYIQKSCPELNFLNLVHPSAVIGKKVILGRGNIIGARTVLNSDCELGDFCIVNNQVSIGHDCIIKNFVTIKTKTTIGGNVYIGDYSIIHSNSNIINNIVIGKPSFIKESTLVLKDIPEASIVEGVPSKIL